VFGLHYRLTRARGALLCPVLKRKVPLGTHQKLSPHDCADDKTNNQKYAQEEHLGRKICSMVSKKNPVEDKGMGVDVWTWVWVRVLVFWCLAGFGHFPG
jgi:hypothetical protein